MLLHGEVLVEEVVLPDEATHLSTFVTPRLTLPQRGVAHLLPVDLERAREARVPSAENGEQRCLPSPTSPHASQPQSPRAEDRRHLATRGVPVDVLQNPALLLRRSLCRGRESSHRRQGRRHHRLLLSERDDDGVGSLVRRGRRGVAVSDMGVHALCAL